MPGSALIYERPAGDSGQLTPRTHVVILGIGHYPHLQNGGGKLAAQTFGLGQLSSPPASARALADWFISSFDCLVRPLGSLSLILSEPGNATSAYKLPGDEKIFRVPRGTRQEVREAFRDAIACSRHPDDQFIVYFCGHGLSAGAANIYALRDFGSDDLGPLDHAINDQTFATRLSQALPSNQLIIFDACRQTSDIVRANEGGGDALVVANPQVRLGMNTPMRQCMMFSTEIDRLSYGKKGQASLCAKAVIRGLSGCVAKRTGAGWQVTSTRILDAMIDLISAETGGVAPQRGDLGRFAEFEVRRLNGAPKIPVFIRKGDGGSLSGASVVCEDAAGTKSKPEQVVEAIWEGELNIGAYTFEITETGQSMRSVKDTVAPTHLPIVL